ncbi:MAG: Ferredoxin--nitrite reductase [Cyanobacteriota bacterium]
MANKFETIKAAKDGLAVRDELADFVKLGWDKIPVEDRDHRLKWLGIFFRPVTPGEFMLRLRVPHGILTSEQLTVLGDIIERYGDRGSGDITTRQNIQVRGIKLEDIPDIFERFTACGLTSVQSGMDNVRNITGSPVSGIDRDELIDTRTLVQAVQDMITGKGQGNPEFTNLPRKFNIAIEGGRDNSVHAEINDVAFVPAQREGEWGFNVLVGGFFSSRRCEAAIPLNAWVPPDQAVVDLCRAILEIFRDHGPRANRQKSRLMWLIDEWGIEQFRTAVAAKLSFSLLDAVPEDGMDRQKQDFLGVHPQKQAGLNFIGLHIPVGRLYAADFKELARLAATYGDGEVRLTVEQNAILTHVPDDRLADLLAEPLLTRFPLDPTTLTRSVVSCTGAQFCNFALIETKNRAIAMAERLAQRLETPKPVRFHWTGCPNSCGQPQVADIGLMGTKVRREGKTVDGVDIYLGGKVGPEAKLGQCVHKGVPCDELEPLLTQILIDQFGACLR